MRDLFAMHRKSSHTLDPEAVLADAARRAEEGLRPTMEFLGETDPEKALALAQRYQGVKLTVAESGEKQWDVTDNGASVAQFFMDYHDQMDKVVIKTGDARIQRFVKELALSHALQFVWDRPAMSRELLQLIPELPLEEYSCERLMRFDRIPASLFELSDEDLSKKLGCFATVVEGRFSTPEEMLTSLLAEIRENTGVELRVRDAQYARLDNTMIKATFQVVSEHTFKLWKHVSRCGWDLHFVPSYYPGENGKTEHALLNGDTNYYIRGSEAGITHIMPPEESVVEREGLFSGGFSKIKHPFYAEGTTLGVEFSSVICLSQSGYRTLYDFLCAALNQRDLYVAVSGGFRAPYDYPSNVINRKGGIEKAAPKAAKRNTRRERMMGAYGEVVHFDSYFGDRRFGKPEPEKLEIRGSEASCMWEYEVLKEEGVLDKSHTPSWFHREGWPEIYAGEEKSF